jgi:hypothetical protein
MGEEERRSDPRQASAFRLTLPGRRSCCVYYESEHDAAVFLIPGVSDAELICSTKPFNCAGGGLRRLPDGLACGKKGGAAVARHRSLSGFS